MSTTMMEPEAPAGQSSRPINILGRSVCLILNCRKLGNTRGVDLGDVDMKMEDQAGDVKTLSSEKREMSANKKLVASKELTACVHVINAAKADMRTFAVSTHRVFGPSTYLVAMKMLRRAVDRLTERKVELALAAEDLAGRWNDIIESRRAALGPMFDEKEYATVAEVRRAFSISWTYAKFDAPEEIAEVDQALYEAAQADFAEKSARAADEYVLGLRESVREIMEDLAEKLGIGEDGKPRVLRGQALDRLTQMIELLPAMNIGQDDPLANVMAVVKARSEGLSVDTLRKAPAVREMLQAAAADAAAKLGEMITTGRRGISFGKVGG